MKHTLQVLIACVGVLGIAVPAFAHHSFSADYDAKKAVKVTGVVTKVECLLVLPLSDAPDAPERERMALIDSINMLTPMMPNKTTYRNVTMLPN